MATDNMVSIPLSSDEDGGKPNKTQQQSCDTTQQPKLQTG